MFIANLLRQYHQHQVVGIAHVPLTGSAVLVHNHSFATYDVFLLGAAIYEDRGRLVRGLGDRLLFKIPLLNRFMTDAGMVEASTTAARDLVNEGHIVGLAPGGMREALRPSTAKYRIDWRERKGFARLAVSAQCPVILAACPRADDVYIVNTCWFTELAYRQLKIPVARVRGLAGTPFPRRVRLTHHLSEAIPPPAVPESSPHFDLVVEQFHQHLTLRMERLMADALR